MTRPPDRKNTVHSFPGATRAQAPSASDASLDLVCTFSAPILASRPNWDMTPGMWEVRQAGKEPQPLVGLGQQDCWAPGMLLSLLFVAREESKLYHTPWEPGGLAQPIEGLSNTNSRTIQIRCGGTWAVEAGEARLQGRPQQV